MGWELSSASCSLLDRDEAAPSSKVDGVFAMSSTRTVLMIVLKRRKQYPWDGTLIRIA